MENKKTNYTDWQYRLVQEEAQLKERTNHLAHFIEGDEYKELDTEDKHLLYEQHHLMKRLLGVLQQRIARFN